MKIHVLEPVAPGTGFFICGRVLNRDRVVATAADFSAIHVKVINEKTGAPIGEVDSPVVADVLFDELRLDAGWTRDKVGYNLAYPTDAGQTPEAGQTYLFMIQFVPQEGSPFYAYFRQPTLKPAF